MKDLQLIKKILLGSSLLVALTACGGGGGSGRNSPPPPAPAPPPPVVGPQSPGGVWFGMDSGGENVSMFITEAGALRVIMRVPGAQFPSFGGGDVSVASNDTLSGSFQLEGALDINTGIQAEDLSCSISGTVAESTSLAAAVLCSDSLGVVIDDMLNLTYDNESYERGSSLEALAGNYTLGFNPATNSLNVAADGTIFGMYDNGAQCTVNGTAIIIDPQYSMFDVRWTFSACSGLLDFFEGVEMSGVALESPPQANRPGSYYFLLTGQTVNGLFAVSVVYEPV